MTANNVSDPLSTYAGTDSPAAASYLDELLATLANRRRRVIVGALADRGGSISVETLASLLADYELLSQVDNSVRRMDVLYTELVHVHVPRLVDAGLVDHDRQADVVEPTETFESVEPALSSFVEQLPTE